MKFKSENSFLYVEGIQFVDGFYETESPNEIEILKRYSDSIDVVNEEEKTSKTKKTEE